MLISIGASAVLYGVLIYGMAHAPTSGRADFLGLWLFSHFAHTQPIIGLYTPSLLHDFQQPWLPDHHGFFPFAYPPHALLALWPLAYAPVPVAEAIWTALGLLAYAAALKLWFGRDLSPLILLAAIVSPASLLNTGLGETGFFTAALLLAGFAWLPTRPVLAGIAFGLLTMKPQLGVLVPFALLGARAWRGMATAAITACVLAAVSLAVFPASLWPGWITHLGDYQRLIASSGQRLFATMGTIDAALLTVGLSPRLAWAAQLVCSLGIAALCLSAFRRAPYRLACCVLFAGVVVAAPHGYIYDAQTLVPALVTLLTVQQSQPTRPRFGTQLLAVLVYLLPLDSLAPFGRHMVYGFVELAFVIFAYRTALRTAAG